MHHNDVAFWRALESLPAGHPDLPRPRICRLLQRAMEAWKHKRRWPSDRDTGHLFDGLAPEDRARVEKLPVVIRKAMAVRRMLEVITTSPVADRLRSLEVHPDEILVGNLPPFSVGQGRECVLYLRDDERLEAALSFLNERSPMGHVVPDHGRVVRLGLKAMVAESRAQAVAGGTGRAADPTKAAFHEAVALALEAVVAYAGRLADEAARVAADLSEDDPNRISLQTVVARLRHVPAEPARDFHEALQAILVMHSALHWTSEIVPLGRLDQILGPYLDADLAAGRVTRSDAQEILDAFWIKLGDRTILDRQHAENRFTFGDGVLTGFFGASNYDQGGLLNQWMQQITVGGVLPNDDPVPVDATNTVTYLCLESARRLPLNSPTLDLRLHRGSPPELFHAAARTLLSGGAHPVLLNDERIIEGLHRHTGGRVALASARNYACDGCYETMFAGETEFSFGFIWATDALEKALNRGMKWWGAGPVNLEGTKDSFRTAPPEEIGDFEGLWSLVLQHLRLACHRYFHSLLTHYGNKARYAPSPLLSALIGGCLESGRDLTGGGARYKLFSPLLVGISTAVDSLHAIRQVVFEAQDSPVDRVSLVELVTCLRRDWGRNPLAPGVEVSETRMADIRKRCQAQAKFGQGVREVDALAWRLIREFHAEVMAVRSDPVHRPRLNDLEERYSREGQPFEILLAPGVGTFEQYVLTGSLAGASADGRHSGDPLASDLSPAPVPPSQDPVRVDSEGRVRHVREVYIDAALTSYGDDSMNLLPDGAPADLNLPEDFPVERLAGIISRFARGEGGNVLTFTVANPATLREATSDPEGHNLVRVRMGGWSEFFITLFPSHQSQHRGRPLYVVDPPVAAPNP